MRRQRKRSPSLWAPLPCFGRTYRSSDGCKHAFEEGELAHLARAKLDPVRQVLAHPPGGYRRRCLGLVVGLPLADRQARAFAGVGEPVADEPGLSPEGLEHAFLGLL